MSIEKLVEALNAAKDSVDNAITGICNAIVEAHQTPLKVEMTDESKQVMEEGRNKMLQRKSSGTANDRSGLFRRVSKKNFAVLIRNDIFLVDL